MAEPLGKHGAQSTQGLPNQQTANTTEEQVAKLAADMSNINAWLSTLVDLLNSSPIFNPPPNPESSQFQGSSTYHMPPLPDSGHPRGATQNQSYHPFSNPEINHLKRIEPLKIPDLWFAGNTVQLTSFLRAIQDFLWPRGSLFQNETQRVVWVSRHFGFRPLENKQHPAPTKNWYNLLSVNSLLEGLIAIFGDKFSKENAKRALAACKQHNLTIGEYNTQFSCLVYLVEDVEENQVEKYVLGLNPCIIRKAMSQQWREACTLQERMALAKEAAAQIDLLALLPPESSHPHTDVTSVAATDLAAGGCNQYNPFGGACPCFRSPSEDLYHGLDVMYKDYEEAEAATVPVSTVQVQLDCSSGGRILVPASFRAAGGLLIPATILVDTGSMANFVNKGFVRKHNLCTRQRKAPIRCVGFDGRKGVGGLVMQDWVGMIHLFSIDLQLVPVPSSFGITWLGLVDAIFGLPWLDQQGWVASGSVKGGHQFSLGSTPLFVIEYLAIEGEPKGIWTFP
ncbi:hypothetical protein PCANC_25391 [Puccinia coronata f. sp. avenae]|uniref:Retrotransposon gag domain-containing protein n=1 Tax=Puccinia coronata f. sp. avenae TaxID=200324 RepID=A0A2N5TR09_9BASI|nr:hypothetical protein PCANC_25391 [Puccinia coronata f. sp. avenae]